MFSGALWKSCRTLHVWRSYKNCLDKKLGPSWEVRFAGIALQLATNVSVAIATITDFLEPIIMGCVGVCLENQKGRFWSEAGVAYLLSGRASNEKSFLSWSVNLACGDSEEISHQQLGSCVSWTCGNRGRAISKKGILFEAEKQRVRSLVRTYWNVLYCLEDAWGVVMKK